MKDADRAQIQRLFQEINDKASALEALCSMRRNERRESTAEVLMRLECLASDLRIGSEDAIKICSSAGSTG